MTLQPLPLCSNSDALPKRIQSNSRGAPRGSQGKLRRVPRLPSLDNAYGNGFSANHPAPSGIVRLRIAPESGGLRSSFKQSPNLGFARRSPFAP